MRQLRRIFTAVLVLLGATLIVPAFGGIVSAHHSNIDASVACDGTVSWKATSWATGPAGTNPDIRVFKAIDGGAQQQIAKGEFNDANNYQFSGTFQWTSGANSITVTSTPYATWGNGTVSPVGSSITIYKPSNCAGQPGVSKSVSCANTSAGHGDGTAVLTLSNTAGAFAGDVIFKVYQVDQTASLPNPTSYTVAHGASKAVSFGPLADGSHFVKILVGTADYTQNFTVDCDSAIPSVSKNVTCVNGDGQVVITLANTGGKSVIFDVTNPQTGTVEHVTVAADSSTTRSFGGFADGDYTVVVKVGNSYYSQTFTVDCDHPLPKVSSKATCTSNDGSVEITLSNDGTEGVVFHVTNPQNGTVEDVAVAAGASAVRTFSGFTDGPHSVTITADGQDFTQSFTVNCDLAPTFSHSETCVDGDGSVVVSMKNDGDDVDATFVLDGVTYTLAPGATKVVTLGGLSDGSHTIPLSINGVDKSFAVLVDCDRPGQPAVEIAQDCANEDGVVTVTLKNIGGQLPLTFKVQGVDHSVPADSSVAVQVAGLLDGTQTISITLGDTDFSRQVTVGCDQAPTIGHSEKCVDSEGGISDGQVVVTLDNNGDDVDVTFTVNGKDYVVGPKQSLDVPVDGLADGINTIAVMAGDLDLSFDIDVKCDHPGTPKIDVQSDCVDNDGTLVITLSAIGGELPIDFTVDGTHYSVDPDSTVDAMIEGLLDDDTPISVLAGQQDLSFVAHTHCDLAPLVNYAQQCANFDDTVTVTIDNEGDDLDVTFTINGTDYVVHPGQSQQVVVGPLADGTNTITVAINGVPQDSIVVQSKCNPTIGVTAVCNSVSADQETIGYWFTVSNTEATDVAVSWNGGSATLPAGQSMSIKANSSPLVLMNNGQVVAQAAAGESECLRTVNFTKKLDGAPATGETYTVRVSRLVGATYQTVMTFDIGANESKTITLPSTLDPAGESYKVEEINSGTASTSIVSPDQLTLSGNLGETVNVVITNGYAAIQLDKQTSTVTVAPGGQITYTLRATNTGGLSLNPVVVYDRLPPMVSLVSAQVDAGAGHCELAESTRPQLVECTFDGALAPGAVSQMITVVVNVDATAVAGSAIVNQAMARGVYPSGTVVSEVGVGTEGPELSCLPVVAGTVCDLSALVEVPVSQPHVESLPPVPTPDVQTVQLPRTGASHVKDMLLVAFGSMLVGGAMLLGRRRLGAR